MPVGDCENAFLDAALSEGVELVRYKQPWLNQRGHFGLPERASTVAGSLHEIFLALDGNSVEQVSKRTTPLPGDFIHPPTGTIIEVDEIQHFTSHRLLTFDLYPAEAPLGYLIDEYRSLCKRFSSTADKYRQTKTAAAFRVGGRQRQRAYYDALRDLATPAMGHPPLVRVPAPDGDGRAAFARSGDRILAALKFASG